MTEAELRQVRDLEVGRYGLGSVRWPGLTDLRGLDLDSIIAIERGSLSLYGDSSRKPKAGCELNKHAIVSLQVKPSRGCGEGGLDKLRARLATISESFGAEFSSYDLETWCFRLPHFDGVA